MEVLVDGKVYVYTKLVLFDNISFAVVIDVVK